MPLHLLGKKSWNVYNKDNIDRVRRDEAIAKAEEEEQKRLAAQAEADRRLAILRGEELPPARTFVTNDAISSDRKRDGHERVDRDAAPRRKRRRIAGENDTERDMRWAKEDAEAADAATVSRTESRRKKSSKHDAPITDSRGHISLFPEPKKGRQAAGPEGKNPEHEAEKAKEKQAFEDQYTMRFANAGGFGEVMKQEPWYQRSVASHRVHEDDQMAEEALQAQAKNVWGNADPRRRDREKQRMSSADPLAAMNVGVRRLREVEAERKRINQERKADLLRLMMEQRHMDHGDTKMRLDGEDDGLDEFNLDGDEATGSSRHHNRRGHHRGHHHKDDSESRHRSHDRHRHHRSQRRSRSRSRDRDLVMERHARRDHGERLQRHKPGVRRRLKDTQQRQRENSPYVG